MAEKWSPKDPGDKTTYWFNFKPMLPAGVTVTACTVDIEPNQHAVAAPYDDLEKVTDSEEVSDDTWVSFRCVGGVPKTGTAAANYTVHYHATLSDGQERDLDKTLQVKERIIR